MNPLKDNSICSENKFILLNKTFNQFLDPNKLLNLRNNKFHNQSHIINTSLWYNNYIYFYSKEQPSRSELSIILLATIQKNHMISIQIQESKRYLYLVRFKPKICPSSSKLSSIFSTVMDRNPSLHL